MNIWSFTGNIGKDAVVSALPNQTSLCGFSVAVSSGCGDKKKTTWVQCTIFGKRAEGGLPQYLVKGQQVAISGEAFLDQWEKDGQKNAIMKVNVNTVDLIGSKQEGQQQTQQQPQADPFDDDVPF
jgi:single-strand DNA-binding protein